MTIKKCDACGNIYEKGYIFAYSLDPYEELIRLMHKQNLDMLQKRIYVKIVATVLKCFFCQ